jgi:phospholipid-binding lipoprotein MlaA
VADPIEPCFHVEQAVRTPRAARETAILDGPAVLKIGGAMRSSLLRRLPALGPAAAMLMAAAPCAAQTEPSDPWEKMNRRFFAVERVLDRSVFGPVARAYSTAPSPFRMALRNFSRNLGEPVVAANDLLQGHVGTAASTVGRFAINSIFGIGGLNDIATDGRIPYHENDFGITLGRWGARPGPYIFLPFVGPSDVRDGFGSLADIGLNPLTYGQYPGRVELGVSTTVIDGVDRRLVAMQDLRTIFETSVDPYATVRSYYLQNRQAEITGATEIGPLPEFDETTAPPGPAPTSAPPAPDVASPTSEASPEAPPPATPPRGSACQPPP